MSMSPVANPQVKKRERKPRWKKTKTVPSVDAESNEVPEESSQSKPRDAALSSESLDAEKAGLNGEHKKRKRRNSIPASAIQPVPTPHDDSTNAAVSRTGMESEDKRKRKRRHGKEKVADNDKSGEERTGGDGVMPGSEEVEKVAMAEVVQVVSKKRKSRKEKTSSAAAQAETNEDVEGGLKPSVPAGEDEQQDPEAKSERKRKRKSKVEEKMVEKEEVENVVDVVANSQEKPTELSTTVVGARTRSKRKNRKNADATPIVEQAVVSAPADNALGSSMADRLSEQAPNKKPKKSKKTMKAPTLSVALVEQSEADAESEAEAEPELVLGPEADLEQEEEQVSSPSPEIIAGPDHEHHISGADHTEDENSDVHAILDVEDSEDAHLHGFSTDEDSSDDENAMDDEFVGISLSELPTVPKDDASVKRKLERAKRQPTEDRGVLYLGRIPHGFYEDQMRAYFSQFGDVTRLRLSRNKKTGRSKHYGFIEFDSSSVAKIVAETMDNYLLMGHILQCKIIPKNEVHPELWIGSNRRWKAVPRDRISRVQHNKERTYEEREKVERRLLKRQSERKRKLEEAGIKYNFDAVAYKKKPKIADS